ncbi:fumarylacetoacetate hydrolase family protein [Shewanella aestuarii]|uniref:Fumarylacetoacetate hydrolase family protein n=1 Tax=Shewanella aestuarii TaxID=1028752 RepID=A0A6G9QJN3_9GAMM|nr:fumarylacetoacetate hydrolase family protein [Shewanella aestuarii]QIR14089.1 fumarylacetoacetate hydrolase family protein [Shewanella aestuarii]
MQQIQIASKADIVPFKVVCVGRNYVEHIKELGNEVPDEMVVFSKPNSAISSQLIAVYQEELHYEAELCFVIKHGQLYAVGVGLDLTKRGLQNKLKSQGLPWERAKGFNGAVVFSEFIVIEQVTSDWCFTLTIDNELVQIGHSSLMMYPPQVILNELQSFMHLDDGDVIMTGTPKGVGKVIKGARFEVKLWADIPFTTEDELVNNLQQLTPLICQQWQAK